MRVPIDSSNVSTLSEMSSLKLQVLNYLLTGLKFLKNVIFGFVNKTLQYAEQFKFIATVIPFHLGKYLNRYYFLHT